MISAEDNVLLTRVGPGTPMGGMMRRYWLPVCTSEQLPRPDAPPLHVRLLGENFVAFRDSSGRVGLLDEYCMHRRASLVLGRVEDNGIRCLYHGWKFATDGTVQETPNHCDDRFKASIKAPAYATREAGGLVWAYIGTKDEEPPFQRYEFFSGPHENRCVFRVNTPANYLQLFEGGTDSSHVGILHCNLANPDWKSKPSFVPEAEDYTSVALAVGDNAPALELENTPYGFHYAAKRRGPFLSDGTSTSSVRVTAVILPTGRIIPLPQYQFFVFEVPQDDVRTSTYIIAHGPKPFDRAKMRAVLGLDNERLWNERDCEYRATAENRYGQDVARMGETWSGLSGLVPEDASIGVSMGPIVERHKEMLVAADSAIVRLRARLLESVRLHMAGKPPLGLMIEDYSKVRSLADTNVAKGQRWQELVPDNMGPARKTTVMA
ncbi:MAG TPA: Rieske 2Fe-2S domain-containing protein [Xanthobacteraceae bacterium]|nr:Rieske 2Fe-2S domain-containing protein [Xanthobacteraceae bacterium]